MCGLFRIEYWNLDNNIPKKRSRDIVSTIITCFKEREQILPDASSLYLVFFESIANPLLLQGFSLIEQLQCLEVLWDLSAIDQTP